MSLAQTNDPRNRLMVLAATCLAYQWTEEPLLQPIIAQLQLDTWHWLRHHPEHVHAFVDAYYDDAAGFLALAGKFVGRPIDLPADYFEHHGIWTVLEQRYEPRAAREQRLHEAGFRSANLNTLRPTDDTMDSGDSEVNVAAVDLVAMDAAESRGEARACYEYFLPDHEGPHGPYFSVSFPRRQVLMLQRIGDYRCAGRFPAREYLAFFSALHEAGDISGADLCLLERWITHEGSPDRKPDPMMQLSAMRRFLAMESDFAEGGGEPFDATDELARSEQVAQQVVNRMIGRGAK